MANPYYNNPPETKFLPGELARGSDVDDKFDAVQAGFSAIADAILNVEHLATGAVPGWDMVASGADLSEPTTVTYSRGTIRVRMTMTYLDGDVTAVVFARSINSGTTYADIGTQTVNYDVDGNVTSVDWSNPV